MASQDRETSTGLIESLLQEGSRFSFFQALYLLEKYLYKPKKERHSSEVDEKAIRLTSSMSMGFPASDIVSIEKVQEGDKTSYAIETSFLGLYGASSPLPAFYTEEILWNEKAQTYVKGFLDLFHHRLLSLFYKSWCKYRFHIQYKPGGKDNFSEMMLALSGLNLINFDKKDISLSSVGFLKFTGLLTQRPKSSSALKNVLKSFFSGAVIQIKEFIGKWFEIIPEQRNSLGVANCRLGKSLTLGSRVFDRAGNFRVVVYPDTFAVFLKFLPGEENYKELQEITRMFCPGILDFDMELKFPPKGVDRIPLKSDRKTRLGFTSWLGELRGEESVIFSPQERFAQ
jgi:type VI secretion system protein ImpH